MSTKLVVTLLALLGALTILAACAGSSTPSGSMTGMEHDSASESSDEMAGMNHESGMADATVAKLEPLSGEAFEVAFMDAMIPHHLSAIEMAQIAVERAQHPELKAAAEAIIAEQEREVAEMSGWLREWYGTEPSGEEQGMAMAGEIEALRTVPDAEFDVAFLRAMIPHHDGAIEMAGLVPGRSERPELLALSEAITAAQRTENEQFARWIAEWGGE